MDMQKFRPQEGPNRLHRDEQIVARVQNYLYENEDKVYIDVNEMADSLQRKYRDYRNRKRGQFRTMVRKAYDDITECVSRKGNVSWREDDEDEVDIESDPEEDISNEILKMYKKPGEKRNGNSSDKELIDICSDDDNTKTDEIPAKRMKIDHPMTTSNKSSKKVNQVELPEIQASNSSEDIQKEKRQRKRQKEKDEDKNYGSKISNTKDEFTAAIPKVKLADFGGKVTSFIDLCETLLHNKKPKLCLNLGKSPPRGILLCGPPGCGKTLLANAIAGELQIPLLSVAAPELVKGISGESENKIRDLFEQAVSIAPCVLFLDEIDVIASPKATAQKEMERRIVSQLLLSMDGLSSKEGESRVLVLGATSRPEALDSALRSPGRFDQELALGIPDKKARESILKIHTANIKLSKDVDLKKIASLTPGYVGGDLVALTNKAVMAALNRALKVLKQEIKDDKMKILNPVPQENINVDNENAKVDDDKKTINIDITTENQDEVQITEPEKEKQPMLEVTEETKSKEEKVQEPVDETVEVIEKTGTVEQTETDKKAETEIIEEKTPKTVSKPSVFEEKINDAEMIKEIAIKDPVEHEVNEILSLLHSNMEFPEEQLVKFCIEQIDFEKALSVIQPSAKREGFATVPDITWDDVGSLQNIRHELYMSIIAPVQHAETFKAFGLASSTGVLLCGPPGCGKTLLAKAIANEAEINFISVKGPELLNMYVGESEKAVRQCFIRAQNSAPCVVFFDEIDALCPKRTNGDSSATSRVVNQMLTEMDGFSGREDVFLMAASNRPDVIDPAVLRPGRFDKILYVGLPNVSDRQDILKALTKNGTKPKFADDVKLEEISSDSRCEGFTGADLAALIREAGIQAFIERMNDPKKDPEICSRHINAALNKIKPSIQEKDMKYYLKLKQLYSVENVANQDVPMDTPENTPLDTSCLDVTMEAMET